ncbi:MAG: hypothetical protein R6X20_19170 [Phycisphaerae bacterium]
MTWKTLLPLAAAAGLIVAAATLTSQAGHAGGGTGLFAGLRKGQSVRLTETGDAFEIETYGGSRSGHQTIAEIGGDYLAITDTRGNVVRIPVTSIKSVTVRN